MSIVRKQLIHTYNYPRVVIDIDVEVDFSSAVAAFYKKAEDILDAWARDDATFNKMHYSQHAKKKRKQLAVSYVMQLYKLAMNFRQFM